ncbi:hypothetical protein QC763_113120 [Podospora pseudopauciseta]|uniref:FAD-binding PCMH-type domain-containing protein n=1 Tax=Podospora pseudopauciseta TaxID=2093780 RepID=A0ABR0I119_9PEZI|nr:hypothetical protein QC763_113120 [Podospora pseudopauciseta]
MIPTGLAVGLSSLLLCSGTASALVWNTFDGPGSPACHNVSRVHNATSVEDMQSVVKSAIQSKSLVRAAGKGHMWYDTQCSDDSTIIIRTANVAGIYDFSLPEGAPHGSVLVDAGVTFFQLAEYLHDRGASVGYTLTNWNISFGGSVAMGAHRSSIREDSMVAAGVLAMDIIDGKGEIRKVKRNESDDDWLAASTSLGLLGIIARIKLKIYPDSKVYAKQNTFDEKEILEGDIYGMIAPYATANLWWWPYKRKFHQRYYDWPVYGWNYDVLIGGLYPDQKAQWDYGLRAYTLELAFPVTMANAVLKRARGLFDEELKRGIIMTSTYRSGINIKFGRHYFDFLGQQTYNTSDGVDWSKGTIMSKKHLDPNYLARFKAVRQKFDPNGIYRNVIGEILEMY